MRIGRYCLASDLAQHLTLAQVSERGTSAAPGFSSSSPCCILSHGESAKVGMSFRPTRKWFSTAYLTSSLAPSSFTTCYSVCGVLIIKASGSIQGSIVMDLVRRLGPWTHRLVLIWQARRQDWGHQFPKDLQSHAQELQAQELRPYNFHFFRSVPHPTSNYLTRLQTLKH